MKLDKLVGERFKERPSDCTVDSHALIVRGGYMKYVANGIFSSYMPLKRITRKIEQILREEMDAIDGQEVQFPVVMPASLWQESGRYESIGKELVRFSDRNESPMVLGMTHEEAAVQLVREYAHSYVRYPFMIYQIQTKFRDEGRARGGLIRVREFKMKDAYSFHIDQQDLEKYYYRAYAAYERIFKRIGMKNFIAVTSDSGMMGGKISHEFMLLTDVGEDTLVLCPKCGYKSNMEVANSVVENYADEVELPMEEVYTADAKEIAEVTKYLGDIPAYKTAKAVCYNIKGDSKTTVVCFVRGDLE
ncbi:MAG: proline--tRNA ligase, partial [Clostridia bacterium]|nr:proline--tRNA ligase [Clostridia bacterium]